MIVRFLLFGVCAAILGGILAIGVGGLLIVAAVGLVLWLLVKLAEYVTERRKAPKVTEPRKKPELAISTPMMLGMIEKHGTQKDFHNANIFAARGKFDRVEDIYARAVGNQR